MPTSQQVTLINYDVSYRGQHVPPGRHGTLEVPVPAPPAPFTQNPGPFGWIGSTNSAGELQAKIHSFIASPNLLLGAYFHTNGWPSYNMPRIPRSDQDSRRAKPLRPKPTRRSAVQLRRPEQSLHAVQRWNGADSGNVGGQG